MIHDFLALRMSWLLEIGTDRVYFSLMLGTASFFQNVKLILQIIAPSKIKIFFIFNFGVTPDNAQELLQFLQSGITSGGA